MAFFEGGGLGVLYYDIRSNRTMGKKARCLSQCLDVFCFFSGTAANTVKGAPLTLSL